jgi:excisionase family DNA binding protein
LIKTIILAPLGTNWTFTKRFRWKVLIVSSDQEVLLTPAEVASLFRVDPKTVTRWAKSGKLTSIRTLGGHRRYKESEVKALLSATTKDNTRNGGI